MEREQIVFVAKLVAYSLIIVGIIMLFAVFMFVITGSVNLVVVVWIIVGALILGIGANGNKIYQKIETN